MRPIHVIMLLFISVLAVGCQQQPSMVSAETIIQPDKGGDFRGIRLGDKPRLIKRTEESSSVYSMPDEIIYRFEPNEADSTWYEISYSFNEDGLNHISLDVFPQSHDLKEHMYTEFTAYYTQRYGQGKRSGNHEEWHGLTMQGRFVTVSLINDHSSNKGNHLRLVFNETNP